LNSDITEQVVGIVKSGLLIFSHGGGSSYMAAIFTNKRIIVIQLEKYEKWLSNKGGILRNEMLEDFSQIISKKRIWEWDFQISLDKIARIKIEQKKNYYLFLFLLD
jgi:hypothetical protein